MELRDLRAFIAVAEAQGFRRAAAHLSIRQSVLSRRIRALEDELGVSLLERHHAGVRLTHAGQRFLKDARAFLALLDDAVETARQAGTAHEGRLRIGIVASIASGFANILLRSWVSDRPNVVIEVAEGSASEQIAGVLSRELDIAMVPGAPNPMGCDSEVIWGEPIMLALSDQHPLGSAETINWSDLEAETFIVSRQAPGPEIHDYVVRHLSDVDKSPRVVRHAVGREALMAMVGLGLGASVVSKAEAGVAYPGVVFVPVMHERLSFSLVWSPANDNPALRSFLSAARVLARKQSAGGV